MDETGKKGADGLAKAARIAAQSYGDTFDALKGAYEALGAHVRAAMEENVKWAQKYAEADIHAAYEYQKGLLDLVNIDTTGPSPHKRGYCGFCATATHKQQTKLDSCPQCGVSYMKYGRK